MMFKRIVLLGGAGFVGSSLALMLKDRFPSIVVVAADSLKRRGSELNIPRLRDAGVPFVHVDIRVNEDLESLTDFDLFIDCAAEPSVQSGTTGSPRYVLDTNLQGTVNCLEAARRSGAAFLFLSTSRIYPIARLNDIPFVERNSRFEWTDTDGLPGVSSRGVSEHFPTDGARSFYGASKLAAETIIQEYVYNCGMRAIINRCGILAGPWQMGKVDQGVVTLWVARHFFRRPLRYMGFGGHGKQVRDILHIHDLFELICRQMNDGEVWDGRSYNVGGGHDVSASLKELTSICQDVTGNSVELSSSPETSDVDLRIYMTDSRRAAADFSWTPLHNVERIVEDIKSWIQTHESTLESLLAT